MKKNLKHFNAKPTGGWGRYKNMKLPSDPYMLLSIINMKLRDSYDSLDELCASMGIDKAELEKRLGDAGFEYMEKVNQFK